MAVPRPIAIDLFCGCGGLTLGLKRAGFNVVAAVDNDPLAIRTYRLNHRRPKIFDDDIREINPSQLMSTIGIAPGQLDLLAGCPPCQGFSTLRTLNGKKKINEPMNDLIFEFIRFVNAMMPKAIMLENVPGLLTDKRLKEFKRQLGHLDYKYEANVFNAIKFGVPQRRRRMILIASLNKRPRFAEPQQRMRTVRDAIGRLGSAGSSGDPVHDHGSKRSARIIKLIARIPHDGGSRGDLPRQSQLECHKNFDGFKDIYGRMAWLKASPTITTGCINPSKGRFLHPEEDRAITLRESALLQGFPRSYKFDLTAGLYQTARLIGNAFPPKFAEHHARELKSVLSGGN